MTIEQGEPPLKPVPKVAATGYSAVAGTILVIIANALGLDLPPEAAAGIVALIAFVGGFIKKDRRAIKPVGV